MTLKIYQVDAFCNRIFSGNPAAVCFLENWLSDSLMQNIAMENNLAETVFFVKKENLFEIRWFTPTVEVDLCGHATLAAAWVLFNKENYDQAEIVFHSHRSGKLSVTNKDGFLTLNFPADGLQTVDGNDSLYGCFNRKPQTILKGKTDYLFIYETEQEIKNMEPNLREIEKLECRGVIISAKGDSVDFVSRFFAPQSGVPEDPVTGSAHTSLIPYWAEILKKNELTAKQVSKRGGFLKCAFLNDRVSIAGEARLYLTGEIFPEHE